MAWTIEVSDKASRQLARLGFDASRRLTHYLRDRVAAADNPRQMGKPLAGELSRYWRYRVGDYRIVCELIDDRLVVLVVEIGHRREVYR